MHFWSNVNNLNRLMIYIYHWCHLIANKIRIDIVLYQFDPFTRTFHFQYDKNHIASGGPKVKILKLIISTNWFNEHSLFKWWQLTILWFAFSLKLNVYTLSTCTVYIILISNVYGTFSVTKYLDLYEKKKQFSNSHLSGVIEFAFAPSSHSHFISCILLSFH